MLKKILACFNPQDDSGDTPVPVANYGTNEQQSLLHRSDPVKPDDANSPNSIVEIVNRLNDASNDKTPPPSPSRNHEKNPPNTNESVGSTRTSSTVGGTPEVVYQYKNSDCKEPLRYGQINFATELFMSDDEQTDEHKTHSDDVYSDLDDEIVNARQLNSP